MSEEPLQEAFADEGTFSGETDESELQALVSSCLLYTSDAADDC